MFLNLFKFPIRLGGEGGGEALSARVYARATRPGPAEGDAPRAGLERREDLVLASKRGPEVRSARGREKGRVPRTVVAVLVPLPVSAASDFTLFRCTLFCSALVAQIKELLAKKHIYEPRGPYVCI